MGVDLRGLDVRVAEQFLHRAQILRGFEQVAGEGVAQHVRVQVLPQFTFAGQFHSHLNRPWTEASALLADEYGVVCGVGHGPQRQPLFEGFAGLFAHRQQPGFTALAEDLNHAIGEVELIEIESGQFGKAQAGRIEQLKNRLIAPREKIILDRPFKQLQCAISIEGFRQSALAFWRCQTRRRVVVAKTFAIQIVIEPAYCREQPREAARGLPLRMQTGDQAAQALNVQRRPAADVLFDAPAKDFIEVAAIGRERVRRHLSLTAQVFAVSVQLPFHAQRTERRELLTRGSTRPMTSAM
ncbi:hypothetical protein D3C87_1248800 [compost metagenome]